MTKPPATKPSSEGGSQDKANRLMQAIVTAFQAQVKTGSANTLLTLAYSTDP